MKGVSVSYLQVNLICSLVWTSYSIKVNNPELIVINSVGAVIGTFFYGMYLYVQAKLGKYLSLMPLAVILGIPAITWF